MFCSGFHPAPVLGEVRVSQPEKRTSLEGPWKINLHDSITFAAPEYDDSSWEDFNLPGSMMRYALDRTGTVAGTLWIRKTVTVDAKHPREDIGLILGRIGNADETYFNGVRIGSTGGSLRGSCRCGTIPVIMRCRSPRSGTAQRMSSPSASGIT